VSTKCRRGLNYDAVVVADPKGSVNEIILRHHGEYGYSRKGQLSLHITQVLWSVVVMEVVIPRMSAKGPASGAINLFAMVSFSSACIRPPI